MVEIRSRRILIGGEPVIVMAGEVHYFRVARDEWEDRIRAAVEVGCTAVASYIPWLWHELPDGTIDVTGRTRPERDVAAFVDLCRDHGLWFVARPGPFVMAELKNEGLPYRLYAEHPQIVPTGWDGRLAPTRTVDYLAPAFLDEVRRWYAAILPLLAERLEPLGGNVIGLQLDNEIGMLAWVSNTPDLTDDLLAAFRSWCSERHGAGLGERYPLDRDWRTVVESPDEAWAAALRVDLGRFMRTRFAAYVQALTEMARDNGIRDIPLLVNVHGTEGGNGVPLAIGISQLVETYAGVPGVVAGSDHYLGEMSLDTTTDVHFINACLAAVNGPDQPVTSLEFEAGTGDYGGGAERLYDSSTTDLKTRLFLAQGNRMVNYYLLAGGINPPLEEPVGDGNDRISFTGERHGTAAPIGPLGERGPAFEGTVRAGRAVAANGRWLADMDEEHDDLAMGFVLDAFMTEYHHPGSAVMTRVVEDLAAHRGPGERKALWRSLLFAGYRFGAVDLQDPDRALPSLVALAGGRHLDAPVQRRLVEHLSAGGRLLLLGPAPERDLEDRECRLLLDALGVEAGEVRRAEAYYYPSVRGHGWADLIPETRVGWWQELRGGTPLLTEVDGHVCGVEVSVGAGTAVLFAAELPSMPAFFAATAARLGVEAGLAVVTDVPGVVVTSTASPGGDRLLHVLNPTGIDARVTVREAGEPFGGGVLHVPAHTGHFLPWGLATPWGRIETSTAEVASLGPDEVVFARPVGESFADPHVRLALEVDEHLRVQVTGSTETSVARRGRRVTVDAAAPHGLTVRFVSQPRTA
jgi:beta-galactosidase